MKELTKILVVDDEEINRKLIKERLNRLGYSAVEEAGNNRDVEILFKNGYVPDLIFMDTSMGRDLAGYEICKRIKNNEYDSAVIGMSASLLFEECAEKWKDAGADGFIDKYSIATLDGVILKAIIIYALKKNDKMFHSVKSDPFKEVQ